MTKQMKNRLFRVFNGYVSCICLIIIAILIINEIFPPQPSFIFMGFLTIIVGGITILSIPAIIYSFLMEFVINPKISHSFWVICISVFFWVITTGAFISSMLMSMKGFDLAVLLRFGLGGLLSGIWIRFMYVRESKEQQVPSWYVFILIYFICIAVIGLLAGIVLLLIIALK